MCSSDLVRKRVRPDEGEISNMSPAKLSWPKRGVAGQEKERQEK